jgi:hypothetical protein
VFRIDHRGAPEADDAGCRRIQNIVADAFDKAVEAGRPLVAEIVADQDMSEIVSGPRIHDQGRICWMFAEGFSHTLPMAFLKRLNCRRAPR